MPPRPQQRGVTLIELMIAMAIGLVIVLAASTAFLGARKLFTTDTDVQAVQDTVRFTRHVVQTLVRQAGYADYAPDHQPDGANIVASNSMLPATSDSGFDFNVIGASNTKPGRKDDSIGIDGADETHGNDSLLVRFYGRTNANGSEADDTIINCLGVGEAGPNPLAPSATDRAWSFFFVDLADDGEPELYCKYRASTGSFASAPIARGVEKLKVVYGYDSDDDSIPNAWLEAKDIAAEAARPGASPNAGWRNVVAVRVGMVVRSSRPTADLKQVEAKLKYRLFPLGAQFEDVFFDPPDDGRFRAVSTITVMLRHPQKERVA